MSMEKKVVLWVYIISIHGNKDLPYVLLGFDVLWWWHCVNLTTLKDAIHTQRLYDFESYFGEILELSVK
jgi:hypothetical protein